MLARRNGSEVSGRHDPDIAPLRKYFIRKAVTRPTLAAAVGLDGRADSAGSAPLETSETIVAVASDPDGRGHSGPTARPRATADAGGSGLDAWTRAAWWRDDLPSLRVAFELGVDVTDALASTRPVDTVDDRGKPQVGRATIVRAFGPHVLTRTGKPRSGRIQDCGHLRPAIRGTEKGLAHWRCGDRLCPSCAERRARHNAAALFAFATQRADDGARVLFVTLTQRKLPVHVETPHDALTRWMKAWRRMTSKRTQLGRRFADTFAGAMRGVELTWSPKGKTHRDGHVVAYSGWHAHGHCLIEVRPGISFAHARRELLQLWKMATGTAGWPAQNVQQVAPVMPGDDGARSRSRIYEVCKYPLKLPSFDSPAVLRSAGEALSGRRVVDGVGSWRCAMGQGKLLLALASDRPIAPLRMADQRVDVLGKPGALLSFCEFRGGERSAFYVDAATFRDAVLRDPRTFDQRDRDRELGRETGPPRPPDTPPWQTTTEPKKPTTEPTQAPVQAWMPF